MLFQINWQVRSIAPPQHIGVLAPDGNRLYANHTTLEYSALLWSSGASQVGCTAHSLTRKIENTSLPKETSNLLRGKETLDLFQMYSWPGNIRELQNVIERSLIVSENESFAVDESWLSRQTLRRLPTSQRELRQRVAAEERQAIEAAPLSRHGRRCLDLILHLPRSNARF